MSWNKYSQNRMWYRAKERYGKKEAMLFLLRFLLMTRVKATPSTFSTLTTISISGKGVRIRLEP